MHYCGDFRTSYQKDIRITSYNVCYTKLLRSAESPPPVVLGGKACFPPDEGEVLSGEMEEGASRINRLAFFLYFAGIVVSSSVKCTVP